MSAEPTPTSPQLFSSSPSPAPASSSPVIIYKPPTIQKLLRTAAINLVLPFINGLMLGFGELFAHEIAFRWGWGGTRVCSLSLSLSLSPLLPNMVLWFLWADEVCVCVC